MQHLYIIYALGQTVSSTLSCRIHCNLEQFDDWVRDREGQWERARERLDGNELFAFVSEKICTKHKRPFQCIKYQSWNIYSS